MLKTNVCFMCVIHLFMTSELCTMAASFSFSMFLECGPKMFKTSINIPMNLSMVYFITTTACVLTILCICIYTVSTWSYICTHFYTSFLLSTAHFLHLLFPLWSEFLSVKDFFVQLFNHFLFFISFYLNLYFCYVFIIIITSRAWMELQNDSTKNTISLQIVL